jgi:putative transposase
MAMSTFSVCHYHIIWATKYRQPSITSEIETVILEAAKRKSSQLRCPLDAINTAYDHVHVAVRIRPALAVAAWVRDIKGLTAYEVNHRYPALETTFRWQRGYSVLTFGKKNLEFVLGYIERQKEHHRAETTIDYLEYIPPENADTDSDDD